MATLTKEARRISVPDSEVDYYLSQGWQSPNTPPPAPPAFPDGEPAASWKAGELKAYAAEHGVELGDATSKKDILPIILSSIVDPDHGAAGTEDS